MTMRILFEGKDELNLQDSSCLFSPNKNYKYNVVFNTGKICKRNLTRVFLGLLLT